VWGGVLGLDGGVCLFLRVFVVGIGGGSHASSFPGRDDPK